MFPRHFEHASCGSLRPRRIGYSSIAYNCAFTIIVTSLAVACEYPTPPIQEISARVVKTLGARNGVLVVFSPAACNLAARDFAALNRIASTPGLRVRGVALIAAPTGGLPSEYSLLFGVEFPVECDSSEVWQETLSMNDMSGPLLAFVRDGHLQALLWSDAALGTGGMPFAWDALGADVPSES